MPDTKRTAWYLALQDEWQFAPDWTLTGGVRDDDYSDFGNTINPRVALVWATNYNLTSKLLYGSAFRAPSFSELYAVNNPVNLGNPQLKPEKIQTTELAFDYRPAFTWQHLFNTYYYKAQDLIGLAPTAVAGQQVAQNLNAQNGYGFEYETKWKPSDSWQLGAAYSWQQSTIQNTNATVPDAPGRLFSTSLLWKPQDDWSVYASTNSVMDRVRAAGDTRGNIPDYTFVNLTLRKRLSRSVEFATSVRNLFDVVGLEPSNGSIPGDYPLAGRSIYAELSYHLGK
jgi:iron complex outermembrane receptor protein